MGTAIANVTVFPTQNDVAQTAGMGKTVYEANLSAIAQLVLAENYVQSGFVLPASSANLTLAVPAGVAYLSGYRVNVPGSTTVTCTASVKNYLFLDLTRDGSNNVNGAEITVNTTGTAPNGDSLLLGIATCSVSVVSSTNQDGMRTGLPQGVKGPVACGAGSTRTHEGSVTIASNQNLSGIHFCTNFTINSGVTVTVPAGARNLIIIASGTITINGTISAVGAGAPSVSAADTPGVASTAASGGGGDGTNNGNGYGGSQIFNGLGLTNGGAEGASGTAFGGNGSQATGSLATPILFPMLCVGGASGGSGVGGASGAGGGSIILSAPTIVLGAAAVLNTSGANGSGTAGAAGGGGGAGNVYMSTRSYIDSGATFTMNGGARGGAGGNGGSGIKQVTLY